MKKIYLFFLYLFYIGFSLFILILVYAIIFPISIPNTHITIYDTYDSVLYESNTNSNLDITECPSFIKEALILVEDQRFYSHIGFDPIRIVKSLLTNIKNGSIVEGGSTITQQYVKNVFLSNEKTMQRKMKEVLLSLQIEMHYSKDDILEGYLNSIYYGHGIYGFKNASDFYFGKNISALTKAEIALLIGIPNGPSYFSPIINLENAYDKRNQILSLLYEHNLINKEEYNNAIKEKIILDDKDFIKENEKNYYIDTVLQEISSYKLEGNLHIHTYYDEKAQSALNKAIIKNNKEENYQSSGIIIQPYTGNIIAIQGGNDYTLSSYNRALYAQRQIASTIKPLLYYCALKEGFTPSSTFSSEPTNFTLEDGSVYSPENYNKYYPNKDISMIHALSTSDNIYAVKTHLYLGINTLSNALKSFGIDSLANPSLALGSVNLSIYDITTIYNTFASEGYYIKPSCISYISSDGKIVFERDIEPKKLLDRNLTLILNQLLTSTYDNNNITNIYPTMYGNKPDKKAGIKSGTSLWDTWVIGFNPYYTIGIWNGYDDNKTIDKKHYEISKKIWLDTFNEVMKEYPDLWYEISNDLKVKKVNPITGKEDKKGSEYWYLR